MHSSVMLLENKSQTNYESSALKLARRFTGKRPVKLTVENSLYVLVEICRHRFHGDLAFSLHLNLVTITLGISRDVADPQATKHFRDDVSESIFSDQAIRPQFQ